MSTNTAQPKKMMALCILEILKKYSDEAHHMSQREIEEKLRSQYLMNVDRKSVKRNLMDLIDYGYDIHYDLVARTNRNTKTGEIESNDILTNFYIENEFTDGELRLLIDSLLFSKHIPAKQCKDLIEKIENLSTVYFKSNLKHISKVPSDRTDNRQVFYNIEILDEAISKSKKVSFKYLSYDICRKQHAKTNSCGSERIYVINPYQMAAKDGKYYLICNNDNFDTISNYRIDRITDIQILEEKRKPFPECEGSSGQALNLEEYMKEHAYMFTADKVRARFIIEKHFINDVVDSFGKDVRFTELEDGRIRVDLATTRESVKLFAKSMTPWVVVEEPVEVREELAEYFREALTKYEG